MKTRQVAEEETSWRKAQMLGRARVYASFLGGVLLELGEEDLAARAESLLMIIESVLHGRPGVPLPQVSRARAIARLRHLQEDPSCHPWLVAEGMRLADELSEGANAARRR